MGFVGDNDECSYDMCIHVLYIIGYINVEGIFMAGHPEIKHMNAPETCCNFATGCCPERGRETDEKAKLR